MKTRTISCVYVGRELHFTFWIVYLTPLLSGFPLEYCNDSEAQKTRTMPLPESQKYNDMCILLDTIPALDRRTDRNGNTTLHSVYADAR